MSSSRFVIWRASRMRIDTSRESIHVKSSVLCLISENTIEEAQLQSWVEFLKITQVSTEYIIWYSSFSLLPVKHYYYCYYIRYYIFNLNIIISEMSLHSIYIHLTKHINSFVLSSVFTFISKSFYHWRLHS